MKAKAKEIKSIDQLIRSLEHVEERELETDSAVNVRGELQRMRGNISAILSFVSHASEPESANPVLERALKEVRRECIRINAGISREMMLLAVRFTPSKLARYSNRVVAQYARLTQATHAMCLLAAPAKAEELLHAL